MLKIVVPMAGRGSRFADAGFTAPKPLVPVHGVPMIKLVIGNLTPSQPHQFIFICQREHDAAYGLTARLADWAPGSQIVLLDRITEGAASTVLAARDHITSDPLMIANSDQYVDLDINEYLAALQNHGGLIMTMTANDPKWSFVGFDAAGIPNRVVEKEVISDQATVGIYNFARGSDFIDAAETMIAANDRVNGEFYVAPVYNYLIRSGASIATYDVGGEADGMYGLGTPADLALFLSLPISERVGHKVSLP
jgi:dTDP-glucose pyrophosphorylase